MWKKVILGGIALAATGYGISKYIECQEMKGTLCDDDRVDDAKVLKAINKLIDKTEVGVYEYCKNRDWIDTPRYKDMISSMASTKNSTYMERIEAMLVNDGKDEDTIDMAKFISFGLNKDLLEVVTDNASWGWYSFAELDMIQDIVREIDSRIDEYVGTHNITPTV